MGHHEILGAGTAGHRRVGAEVTHTAHAPKRSRPLHVRSVLPLCCSTDDGDDGMLSGLISDENNPYKTSKANRLRAKYGDKIVTGTGESREIVENRLAADLAQFKAERGI